MNSGRRQRSTIVMMMRLGHWLELLYKAIIWWRLKYRWWRLFINPWHPHLVVLSCFFALVVWVIVVISVPIQVHQRAEPQQEFKAEHGEIQGSWGAWGSWSTCSRSCGKGVQEQSMPCLPAYTPTQHSSRRSGSHPQQPGHGISAVQPTLSLHSDTGRPLNSSRRGERRKETRPSGRRYHSWFWLQNKSVL